MPQEDVSDAAAPLANAALDSVSEVGPDFSEVVRELGPATAGVNTTDADGDSEEDGIAIDFSDLGGNSIDFFWNEKCPKNWNENWNEFWKEIWNEILFYFTTNPDSIGKKNAPKIGMSWSSYLCPFKK